MRPNTLAVAAVSALMAVATVRAAERATGARIAGGSPDAVRLAVGVFVGTPAGLCTATLIDPSWALTAATCAGAAAGGSFLVGSDYTSPDQMLSVVGIHLDPQYDAGTGEHDFALLELASPAVGVTPMALLTPADDDLEIGTPLTLVGFGLTESGANSLRREAAANVSELTAPTLVTNGPGQLCFGDLGAPALRQVESAEAVAAVGVASNAVMCSAATESSFARVSSAYDNFIFPTLAGLPLPIFDDGFESGSTSAWSLSLP